MEAIAVYIVQKTKRKGTNEDVEMIIMEREWGYFIG